MISEIETKEGKEYIDSGAEALDVRSQKEFDEYHLDGSVNIDIDGGEFEEKIEDLDKSKKYVVYCGSGGRSARATQVMVDSGFDNAHSLAGGIKKWKKEGLPVVEE